VIFGEMLHRLYPAERQYAPNDEAAVTMRTALEGLVGCPSGKAPTAKQVAVKLRLFRRRVHGGCFLDTDESKSRKDGRTWKLFAS